MNDYCNLARPLSGERGMALISALLLLLVISLLAVGLSMDSSMDIRGAAYQKFRAKSFGAAESGLMASSDILESNIDDSGWAAGPIEFPHLSPDYDGLLTILGDGSFYLDENSVKARTMSMTGDIAAAVTIQKGASVAGKGGAMQVAAGYAGMGKGLGGGGAHILYNIEATGNDVDNVTTTVAMDYRVVTK